MSKWAYAVLSIVFIALSGIAFGWGQIIEPFKADYIADYARLGTYGDFVGGVLGTIFGVISVLLMFKTFDHQRIATADNQTQLEIERFHDLFFELLRLYQSQVSDLCGVYRTFEKSKKDNLTEDENTEVYEYSYNNKDFFDFEKEKLQRVFTPKKSFEQNQAEALKTYMFFYIKNKDKIGAYYRTLYRIYDLIDNAKTIPEGIKKDYLKIIRAQLTETELFFLRYNALTYYGHKFIKYINEYNILKHLPVFELLEFKDWWKDLDAVERAGLNIVFTNLRDTLHKVWDRKNVKISTSGKIDSKYSFMIEIRNCADVEIKVVIDDSKESTSMELLAFKHFDAKRLQQLLDCYIKEIFIYSHFSSHNKTAITYSDHPIKRGNTTTINSGIKNSNGQPLILKCRRVDRV
ncbi:MAG: putative phage abortive infection protein [Alphaproteobacteria bacterium]|nr:putative phage abortive infection protein [Alphaproteobacteria bacterium]